MIVFISPYPIMMSQLVGSVFTTGVDQPLNLSGSSQTGFPIEQHRSKKSAISRGRDELKQKPVTKDINVPVVQPALKLLLFDGINNQLMGSWRRGC